MVSTSMCTTVVEKLGKVGSRKIPKLPDLWHTHTPPYRFFFCMTLYPSPKVQYAGHISSPFDLSHAGLSWATSGEPWSHASRAVFGQALESHLPTSQLGKWTETPLKHVPGSANISIVFPTSAFRWDGQTDRRTDEQKDRRTSRFCKKII